MDGKLLILCDELPGDYKGYSVKDVYFLRSEIIDPDDVPERLFVCWDSIIPQDRSFIESCMHYATTYQKIPADFESTKTGKTDGKYGTVKGSIQEDSYVDVLDSNIEILSASYQRGEDIRGEMMELAVQYPMKATQQFLDDFSSMLDKYGIVRVLVAHKGDVDLEVVKYRNALMGSWQNQNRVKREKQSRAELVEPMVYPDFGQLYSRSGNELMKIYSLPIFGEEKNKERKYV